MAKVLYISYDGMTDPLGQSQVMPYLKQLALNNHSITILSTEKQQNFEKYAHIIEQELCESSISWHFIQYTKTPPVLSTVLDIIKLRSKAIKLHSLHHFDIVHCRRYIAAII
ncbi:MAG: hypothetical protein SNJ71_00850, partial [Bacteroidales bacterium]